MKLGFLYAGQGSQHPGMGADLYERFPTFRAVLDSAAKQVDFDLKEVSFTDAKGVLNQTRYTQPCMVAFAAGMTAQKIHMQMQLKPLQLLSQHKTISLCYQMSALTHLHSVLHLNFLMMLNHYQRNWFHLL